MPESEFGHHSDSCVLMRKNEGGTWAVSSILSRPAPTKNTARPSRKRNGLREEGMLRKKVMMSSAPLPTLFGWLLPHFLSCVAAVFTEQESSAV